MMGNDKTVGEGMTTHVCPEHGIPDCSPLLNGCSWRTEWEEQAGRVLSLRGNGNGPEQVLPTLTSDDLREHCIGTIHALRPDTTFSLEEITQWHDIDHTVQSIHRDHSHRKPNG